MIAPALCSERVVDSAFPRELHGEINPEYASTGLFFCNRHQEVLFTRPQSVDNMRKSKSIFPVDVRLTLKIRLPIIHLKRRIVYDKVVVRIVRNR